VRHAMGGHPQTEAGRGGLRLSVGYERRGGAWVAMRQRRVLRDAAAAVRLTEAGSLVQGSDDAVERCTAHPS